MCMILFVKDSAPYLIPSDIITIRGAGCITGMGGSCWQLQQELQQLFGTAPDLAE